MAACIFLLVLGQVDFQKKILARGKKIQVKYKQLLIIRKLDGSLYLFGWLLK